MIFQNSEKKHIIFMLLDFVLTSQSYFSMCTADILKFCIAIELTYSPCRECQVCVESWQKRVAAQQHEIFLFCDGPLLWLASEVSLLHSSHCTGHSGRGGQLEKILRGWRQWP